jgi:hypothetical protein
MYRDVSAITVTAAHREKGVCGRRPALLFAEILPRSVRHAPQTTRHFGRDDKSRKGTGHYKG